MTRDGKKIRLFANIGSVGDIAKVLANDAGGLAFSGVSSSIWKSRIIQLKKSSFRPINLHWR